MLSVFLLAGLTTGEQALAVPRGKNETAWEEMPSHEWNSDDGMPHPLKAEAGSDSSLPFLDFFTLSRGRIRG